MKALVFGAKDQVEVGTLPDPKAGFGQVVIKVRAGGICGTVFGACTAATAPATFPNVPAQEYAGEIVEIGRR